MGKREEFEGKQQAVMYQHTHNQIFQERKNPHCTDGRNQWKVGRKKASNTVAAAFIPGVSEKTSTASPKKNAHNINALRGVSDSNFSIK